MLAAEMIDLEHGLHSSSVKEIFMKRKFGRDYSLSVVAPFTAILILLIAAGVLAQTPAAGQWFTQRTVVSAQEDPDRKSVV